MTVAITIAVVALVIAAYRWSSRRGRSVDSQALYELRVRDARTVTRRNIGGGGGGSGRL
jgi:hypothetical protein